MFFIQYLWCIYDSAWNYVLSRKKKYFNAFSNWFTLMCIMWHILLWLKSKFGPKRQIFRDMSLYWDFDSKSWIVDFFTRFTCDKIPQNNFSCQNFSVENNYLSRCLVFRIPLFCSWDHGSSCLHFFCHFISAQRSHLEPPSLLSYRRV